MPCRRPWSQSFFSPRRFVAVLGSRTTSEPLETSKWRPREPICFRRLDPRSSRLKYRQCKPARAAFCRRIENPREDFMVPGAPSMRTTWPQGTPPSSVWSSPSTKVRTRAGRSPGASVGTAAPRRFAVNDVSMENASSISSRMSRSRSSSAVGPVDFRSDFLGFLLRQPMVRPELEDFRETSSRLREVLERLEDQAPLDPGFRVTGMDHGCPIQDGGGRLHVAEHPQNPAESEPRLLVFRTQLEGAQIPDGGLVRSAEPQVCFREQDPGSPVFVVPCDRLEQRVD